MKRKKREDGEEEEDKSFPTIFFSLKSIIFQLTQMRFKTRLQSNKSVIKDRHTRLLLHISNLFAHIIHEGKSTCHLATALRDLFLSKYFHRKTT